MLLIDLVGCPQLSQAFIRTMRMGLFYQFCEGRALNNANHDSGTINIVARTSLDGGRTFGPQRLIAEDGENTVGNPCPVYDRDTGIIWLFMTGNDGNINEAEIIANKGRRRVLVMHSEDSGETWSAIEDMTDTLALANWTWYATGPCHGLQTNSGRLVIPCDHIVYPLIAGNVGRSYSSHILYSDDHGKTWHIGGDVGPATNECSVAESKDGLLYITLRRIPGNGQRGFSLSEDGGATWKPVGDTGLPDPTCQASVIAGPEAGKDGFYPLYLTNASHPKERRNLTLQTSYDGGKTWPDKRIVEEGFSAYSDLAFIDKDHLAVFYEAAGTGKKSYSEIVFTILRVGRAPGY